MRTSFRNRHVFFYGLFKMVYWKKNLQIAIIILVLALVLDHVLIGHNSIGTKGDYFQQMLLMLPIQELFQILKFGIQCFCCFLFKHGKSFCRVHEWYHTGTANKYDITRGICLIECFYSTRNIFEFEFEFLNHYNDVVWQNQKFKFISTELYLENVDT